MRKYISFLMMAAALVACSREVQPEVIEQPEAPKTYTLSISASKMELTKALELNGSTLNAIWKEGEEVYVFMNNQQIGELSPIIETLVYPEKVSCTLSGPFITVPEAGDVLTLYFASNNYSGQDGTLDFIPDCCDYAVATLHVTGVNNGQIESSEGKADFVNQQAIIKFTLQDKDNSSAAISPTALTITDGTNTATVSTVSSTYTKNGEGVLYVAFPAAGVAKTISMTATVGNDTYIYEKSGVTFTNGRYYAITVKMSKNPLATPLTLEATSNGTIVVKKPKSSMKYSLNGGIRTEMSGNSAEIQVQEGDKVQFYGSENSYSTTKTKIYGGTANVKAYGNIMSLINETDYATTTTFTGNAPFCEFFKWNTTLTDASGLLLPVTTLVASCYEGMFNGCTSLTAAPELPATTLANHCYWSMFYGCSNLTAAPELKAETLVDSCYGQMFYDCASLTSVTCMAKNIDAENCLSSWLGNLETTGTLYVDETMTEKSWNKPSGWSVVAKP